jgi:DNA-binding LacI/PurR family transcriptional regulator
MVRLNEVARRARVSMSTVSRVLTGAAGVRPRTRSRVERAIEELRYRPSRVARRLRLHGGRAHLLGLIIPDIRNSFFTEIARAVEDVARSQDYPVIVCNSDEDPDREASYLDVLRSESADGVILPPIRGDIATARRLAGLGLPVVCLDRRLARSTVDTVVVDNAQSAREAVAHLIGLGHRRIGLITGPLNLSTSLERREGYRQALADHDLPFEEELTGSGPPWREEGERLASALLDLPSPPTALFTGNELLTLGALEAIRGRGLRIPADVALIGFDDAPWAGLVDPPLTIVRQPSYEIGRRAAELLFARLADPLRPPVLVVLGCSLLVRRSCGSGLARQEAREPRSRGRPSK